MTVGPRIPAKAAMPEDRSDAIVVSFEYKWYTAIIRAAFSLVIRKRIPTSHKPDWMYFHVNAPKSVICARASVTAVGTMPTKLLCTFTSELALHPDEIAQYCKGREEVGVYRIAGVTLPAVEASMAVLQRELIYSPPQSFMFLSRQAKAVIDRICNFSVAPHATRTVHR
jgi:hypothetical protein